LIAQTIARLDDHSVDLKRVPPKSRPAASSSIKEAARKDPAVHVSLSSDSLIKEPGTSEPRSHSTKKPLPGRAGEPSKPAPPTVIGGLITEYHSEELLRRAIAPRRRRAVRGVICWRKRKCQHLLTAPLRVLVLPRPDACRCRCHPGSSAENRTAQLVRKWGPSLVRRNKFARARRRLTNAGIRRRGAKILFPRSGLRRTEATILGRPLGLRGGVRRALPAGTGAKTVC
jgi:hypothetical protein